MESRRNSSGTSSQDLIRCSSATKSKVYCTKNMRWNWMQKILWTDQRQKQNHKQENLLALHSSRIVAMDRRNWIDIDKGKYSLSKYEVSKKVIHLLRHSQKVHREEDGAVHFWRIKENLQNPFPQSIHWSDDQWKACLAAGGGARRRFQYCNDDSGTIVYFWARDRQYSSCLLILGTKVTRILTRLIWTYHVMHNTCTVHGRVIKTRYIGRHQSCD